MVCLFVTVCISRTLRRTRYSLLAILLVLFFTWLFSIMTAFFLETWMAAMTMISTCTLAVFVFTLRGLLDYQVVNRIKRAYLKNKVGNVVYEDSREVPSRKTTYGSPRHRVRSQAVTPAPETLVEGDEYL